MIVAMVSLHLSNSSAMFNPLSTFTVQNFSLIRKPAIKICAQNPSAEGKYVTRRPKTNPSAKSPGQIYLEKVLTKKDSRASTEKKLHEKPTKKKEGDKKDKKVKRGFPVSTEPTCYGCGAPLQIVEADGPGYLTPDLYQLKKRHGQLREVLCRRCQLLTHGHLITAVGGHGGYSGGKQFVTAEELREKLTHLRHQKALIVKLVDIVDFNGSFLSRVRELVGANPIMLVATKVDLLPKGTDLHAVGDWLVEAILKKKLNDSLCGKFCVVVLVRGAISPLCGNFADVICCFLILCEMLDDCSVISVHLTSAKSLSGFVGIASEIQKERKGRDVYVLGAANVGKSAFIDALLKTMAVKNFVSQAARKYKPVQSAVPGTTLGPIPIDAFLGEGKLYDTPGIHLHHRQAAVVNAEDLSLLAPQSRLKGCIVSIDALNNVNQDLFYTSENTSFEEYKSREVKVSQTKSEVKGSSRNIRMPRNLNGLSIFWGGLVRIDMVKVPFDMRVTIYGPKAIKIKVVPVSEADEFYQKELGEVLSPPTGKEKASFWPGLERIHPIKINVEHTDRPVSDIAISGLGWVTIEPDSSMSSSSETRITSLSDDRQLELLFHVPKPVEIFVRPPVPIGKFGSLWYEYSELTEKEEEARPKIFY